MCPDMNHCDQPPGSPPTGADEIRAAALQYVRQVCGSQTSSEDHEAAFNLAVDQVAEATRLLLESLQTKPPPQSTTEWEEDDLRFFYGGAW